MTGGSASLAEVLPPVSESVAVRRRRLAQRQRKYLAVADAARNLPLQILLSQGLMLATTGAQGFISLSILWSSFIQAEFLPSSVCFAPNASSLLTLASDKITTFCQNNTSDFSYGVVLLLLSFGVAAAGFVVNKARVVLGSTLSLDMVDKQSNDAIKGID